MSSTYQPCGHEAPESVQSGPETTCSVCNQRVRYVRTPEVFVPGKERRHVERRNR